MSWKVKVEDNTVATLYALLAIVFSGCESAEKQKAPDVYMAENNKSGGGSGSAAAVIARNKEHSNVVARPRSGFFGGVRGSAS